MVPNNSNGKNMTKKSRLSLFTLFRLFLVSPRKLDYAHDCVSMIALQHTLCIGFTHKMQINPGQRAIYTA